MSEHLLTTRQAAELMGLCVREIQHLCSIGRLKHERFGKSIVIRVADLAALPDNRYGRPLKCVCGKCMTCLWREYRRQLRERKAG
jgi:excisionase family DNA binding protein